MANFSFETNNSKVLSIELLDHLLEQFPLGNSLIHGEDHWMRVLYNGRLLSRETRANLNVVELFSVLHDCKRDNDDYDLEHGRRAAEYIREIRSTWLNINDEELELLVEACEYHSDGFIEGDITVQTCWDADRLDLGRVGVYPSPNRLCTDTARRSEVIDAAYRRSISG
jgi:uncharacterized protein